MSTHTQWYRNPILLWGSFAAGFLCPYFFTIFLSLGIASAYRALRIEYRELGPYWQAKSQKVPFRVRRWLHHRPAYPLAPSRPAFHVIILR